MLKIAHRGASGYAPENSLAAFFRAIDLGADALELDVHCCRTGELIVIHDETVERTTGGRGAVRDLSLEQIRALSLPNGEKVPTLDEVLDACGARVGYFVELKQADAAIGAAEALRARIAHGWDRDSLWLVSFRHEAFEALKGEAPLNVGASFESLDETSFRTALSIGARSLLPRHDGFTADHVTEAGRLGLKVFTWTANDPAEIVRLRGIGVDGIMSDYPDRL